MRKIRRNLFTYERISKLCDCQVALDRIVIGDRDKIHPPLAKKSIEISWVAIAIREIESPKKPLLGAGAEPRMDMKIAKTHGCSG
jgi:hypothetical protein